MFLRKKLSLLVLAMSAGVSIAAQEGPSYELATDIADHYIKDFPSEGRQTEQPKKEQKRIKHSKST